MNRWYLVLLATASCSSLFSTVNLTSNQTANKEEWVTIFVHGAVALRANLSPALIPRIIDDKIEGTCYAKNVLAIREHPYLFTMQAMQKCGLHPIASKIASPPGAFAFASLYDDVLHKCCGTDIKHQYYTFGWSGLLSASRRQQDSRKLYIALRDLRNTLLAQGRSPKFEIIGYSHGANLGLNLTTIRAYDFPEDTFMIDRLILLGMPVSCNSLAHIQLPLFGHIYHLYSKKDITQRLDITVPGLIPHRTFTGCLPANLTQVELRLSAPEYKICKNSIRQLRGIRNQSPGHFELWFFGWAPHFYRSTLPIYPLPFATFIPYILSAAHAHPHGSSRLTVDVRPKEQKIIVTDNKCRRTQVPFMDEKSLIALQEKAISFHPGQPQYLAENLRLKRTINPENYK